MNYFLDKKKTISKETFFEKVSEKCEDWVKLSQSDVQGILRRFQSLLFDSYEEIICRLQEKTRFSEFIHLTELIREFRIHGIVNSDSEECCARSLFYYYSKSVKKVPYMTVVTALNENNVDEKFLVNIMNESSEDNQGSNDSFVVDEEENLELLDDVSIDKKEIIDYD